MMHTMSAAHALCCLIVGGHQSSANRLAVRGRLSVRGALPATLSSYRCGACVKGTPELEPII